MTIDALAGKRRTSSADAGEALVIGELDANILDCPGCRRPLAAGVGRCPGCGTRLLAGVRLSKALAFLGTGVLLGVVAGGSLVGLATLTTTVGAGSGTVTTPGATIAPLASTAPLASAPVQPTVAPVDGAPAAALSALRQATLLHQRLVVDGDRLAVALAAPEPSTAELARILRSLAGNASVGERIGPVVGEWSRGSALAGSLGELYVAIGSTAREGLGAALGNRTAYVEAATAMQSILAGLPALDADARVLAAAAGVELPPLATEPAAP